MWRIEDSFKKRLQKRLSFLYPQANLNRILDRIALLVARYESLSSKVDPSLWEQNVTILISYGHMIQEKGTVPLQSLLQFLDSQLQEYIQGIHILPFFPYSSDDGFSVIDYRKVNPELGDWQDIERIARKYILMVDLVLNHVSKCSSWFQDYIGGILPALDFFIEVDPKTDLSQVARPRTTPLLTPVDTVLGTKWVWTTFSEDQIDLNYKNPDVLIEMLDILLFYILKGARIIRLDAIAYLWKEIGTSCLNLPQTHEVVKLFRDIIDYLAPGVLLLTETNLPQEDNYSYFGEQDEAHMVYQFSLPPLLLYSFHHQDSQLLTQWLQNISPPENCTFFNFTASHDGIGLRPLEGLISEKELENLVQTIQDLGGLVSYRQEKDTQKPYELNITYFDALKDPEDKDNISLQIQRFLCSQAIMLSLQGIPGIYLPSLFGTSNYYEGVEKNKQNRSINRPIFQYEELKNKLNNPKSKEYIVFKEYKKMLLARKNHIAFHHESKQEVLNLEKGLLGLKRIPGTESESVFCLYNLTKNSRTIPLDKIESGLNKVKDLLTDNIISKEINLPPYGYLWFKPV
ncbi:MAG: Putative sucrose phosphorylase [Desulfonauticus sp. 38_4375]|nr:MAG: Putative sucrose phosphorylase [Desulfonauticus sp. 38_4375]